MIKAVMIDSREPESVQKLTFGGVPAVVTMLDTGDLWVSCADDALLIVERKTPSDLLASIGDGRLFGQAQRMRERSPWCYIVVTGWLMPTHDNKTMVGGKVLGWDWRAVQGALLDVQEIGVAVVHCDHENAFEKTVMHLSDRRRTERVYNPAVASRVISPAEKILTALPGIGLERAQNILEFTGNDVARALAWLTMLGTYGDVAGIGDGIKTQVRQALTLNPEEHLTVWSADSYQYMISCARDAAQKEAA